MEHKQNLGIYLSYNNATAVLLSGSGHKFTLHNSFTVNVDPELDSHCRIRSLITQIAKKTSELGLKFEETTVSIDCSMYAQHDIHSEFTDHKQIASTIAFDAEEAVVTDSNELAVTFAVTGTNPLGSNVTIFTSQRGMMTEILNEFKAVNMDPIIVEPDIVCLARYIKQNLPGNLDDETLNVIIAPGICYFISPAKPGFQPLVRCFMLYPSQDIVPLLTRQIPITIAAHAPHAQTPITKIALTGNLENIIPDTLAEATGFDIKTDELVDPSLVPDDTSNTSIAIAYGTAMSELAKTDTSDFRESFLPFQGKKILLKKTVKIITIYLTVLLIALGVYFQMKVFSINKATAQYQENFIDTYSDVMYGKNPSTQDKRSIEAQLRAEAIRIKKSGAGLSVGDERSIPAQLTYLLQVINDMPKTVIVDINKMNITARGITVSGTAKSQGHALVLSKGISNHPKLTKTTESYTNNTFRISAELK